jgi:hypothetical protein
MGWNREVKDWLPTCSPNSEEQPYGRDLGIAGLFRRLFNPFH